MVFRILCQIKKFSSKALPWKEEHEKRAVIVVVVVVATAAATPMEETDKAGKKDECEVG